MNKMKKQGIKLKKLRLVGTFIVLTMMVASVVMIRPASSSILSSPPGPGETRLVSITQAHQGGGDADSGLYSSSIYQERPIAVSDNGQYVVFISDANDLVSNVQDPDIDGQKTLDVFLRDCWSDTTICISQVNGYTFGSLDGNIGGEVGISGNGRYIVFTASEYMVAYFGKTIKQYPSGLLKFKNEIFVFDRNNPTNMFIPSYSIKESDLQLEGWPRIIYAFPSISDDGCTITFQACPPAYVGLQRLPSVYAIKDIDYAKDIYTFLTVSTYAYDYDPNGEGHRAGELATGYTHPHISGDGQYVAFIGCPTDLFIHENNFWDRHSEYSYDLIITRNISNPSDYRVVSLPNGTGWPIPKNASLSTLPDRDCGHGYYGIDSFDLTDNGRYIVFGTAATNMIPESPDIDGAIDIYLYDCALSHTERISHKFVGADPTSYSSAKEHPSISDDGRYVTFTTQDKYIVRPGDQDYCDDVYIYDRISHYTYRASARDDSLKPPQQPNQDSNYGVISGDGNVVAFGSKATNLVSQSIPGSGYICNVYIRVPLKGDLDGDGDVDLSDLSQLLAHYKTTSGATYAQGDIDGDGDVDLSDLALLLANYGK